jgi:hypothetical protein
MSKKKYRKINLLSRRFPADNPAPGLYLYTLELSDDTGVACDLY